MQVNVLLFPGVTQLDLTGPYEVLARVPGFTVDLVSADLAPVVSDRGLILTPTASFDSARLADVLVVPGGPGVDEAMTLAPWVDFIARQAAGARYVLGICTGALLLGAAGLLRGKRASSHWMAREFLPAFGALPDDARICVDGSLITAGGVTSGIDMALQAVALMRDEDTARQIQLHIEYDPAPPFPGGTPETSPPHIVTRCREAGIARQQARAAAVEQARRNLARRLEGEAARQGTAG
ncbi:DJ-1/PfpI family protein [Mitsuaria sp. GD03876]|uniref:DJ-1/PfpI family protein n=1 Tax=Mitsuaria sp. GD03876 TaxID=2975399 RepID=UPI002446C054|nr:DJ-1/PfpI family protein [Mitsuaria sp. GD03876]MDH0865849.1 DJ-1/PfpI family protein [Mitsuaria sp. GD03876]